MTALLYVLLSLKITRQVDLQIKEFYKTRIHSDIQEFYREMEGYAALMENRIQRFKTLVERSEAVAKQVVPPKETTTSGEPASNAPSGERKMPKKTGRVTSKESKPMAEQNKKQTVDLPKKTTDKKAGQKLAEKPLPARRINEKNVAPAESRAPMVSPAPPAMTAEMGDNDDDTAIAAELVKDLFAQDEVQLSHKKSSAAPAQQVRPVARKETPPITESGSAVMGFLARIGKTVESALVAPKPAAPTGSASSKSTTAPPAGQSMKNPDFAEVLRRAEQIKAEKQAERERAELEARAEFYSAGDTFVASAQEKKTVPTSGEKATTTFSEKDAVNLVDPAPANSRQRNALAVKNLDENTIRFLVDSLRHDAGYRRQALRALMENNIPLEEIARLSRIDIGELQLMQQLDKF